MNSEDAKRDLPQLLASRGIGKVTTNYKLRDWVSPDSATGENRSRSYTANTAELCLSRGGAAAAPAGCGELSADGNRGISSCRHPRMGQHDMPCLRKTGEKRDEHDAAVGGIFLVFPALCGQPQRTKSWYLRRKRTNICRSTCISAESNMRCLHLLYSRFYTKFLHDIGVGRFRRAVYEAV